MDDDRLARAREGDLDAFLDLVRPRAGRLLRLATIGAGDPETAHRAATAAISTAWRDVRRLEASGRLDTALERALVAGLPRRPVAGRVRGGAEPLRSALAALGPAERVALARCLDARPDPVALAVAGRAGVEVDAAMGAAATEAGGPRPGSPDPAIEIVDLDGPLAGWDLARLRGALGAMAGDGSPDPDELIDALRAALAATRPRARPLAALRGAVPGPAALARGAGLVLAAAVGIGMLLSLAPGRPAPGPADDPGNAAATPDGVTGAGGGRGGNGLVTGEAAAIDTPGDFPAEIDGMRVIGVREARRLARDPALAGRSLAIRGWLAPPELREPCRVPAAVEPAGDGSPLPEPVAVGDPLAVDAAFCHRDAVLRETADRQWSGAHLHPQLLPGTGLGRVRRLFAARDEPVPVVVLAHFGDPRAGSCATGGRHCGEELVVDRVAWVLGAPARPPIAVRPPSSVPDAYDAGRRAILLAERAFGGIRAVAASGLPAADLALVEPAAGGMMPRTRFAWLVRAIVEPRPSDPLGAIRTWLVVDEERGEVIPAPGAVAASSGARLPAGEVVVGADTGFLFPKVVDGAPVHTVAEARALVAAGLPEGSAIAVAGWLSTPTLAGACLAGAPGVDGPRDEAAAFCRRATVLRGPTPDGRAIALQLPPGAPALPIEEAVVARRMPVAVIALVESGSPRAEPCLPGRGRCARPLALERLLWVDGDNAALAVAELDRAGLPPPRLAVAEVRAIAERAAGRGIRVASIVRVPVARRGDVAPGAERVAVAGDHAWIARIRSPWAGSAAGVERLSWLLVDDATGRAAAEPRPIADLPELPPPATPPG